MEKKKLMSIVASLALVGVIGIGSTLAYLSDKDSVLNQLNVGKIGIYLTEGSTTPGAEVGSEGIVYTDPIYPGDTVSKIPALHLDNDSADSYLRVKITVEDVADKDGLPLEYKEDILKNLTPQLAEYGWVSGTDGYYYYQEIATAKNRDGYTLFDTVTFSKTWTSEFLSGDEAFTINIQGEAVQSDHFDSELIKNDTGQIVGWNTDNTDLV